VDGYSIIYYHIGELLYRGKIGPNNIEDREVIAKGEIVKTFHWAFEK